MHGFGSQKSLTLDGDFSVTAKEFAYSASENITIRSGVVVGKSKYSCFMAPGTLTVDNGVKKVEAHFEEDYLAAGSYSFGDNTVISEPQGGYIDVSPEGYQAIYNSDGTYAHDVVIFGVPSVVSFDITVTGKLSRRRMFTTARKQQNLPRLPKNTTFSAAGSRIKSAPRHMISTPQ